MSSFFSDIFSTLSSVLEGDHANYASWGQAIEKKVQALHTLFQPLMTKCDHAGQIQNNLNQVQTALVDFLPELSVDTYSGTARNIHHVQQARSALLNLWTYLVHVLDKIEEVRFTLLFLDVIWRIMTRPEFDIEYLGLDDKGVAHTTPDCLQDFKRYRRLIYNTHSHISVKLSESNPVSLNGALIFKLELLMAYSRILSVCFFRLPEVGNAIIAALRTSIHAVSYDLEDYEYREPVNTRGFNFDAFVERQELIESESLPELKINIKELEAPLPTPEADPILKETVATLTTELIPKLLDLNGEPSSPPLESVAIVPPQVADDKKLAASVETAPPLVADKKILASVEERVKETPPKNSTPQHPLTPNAEKTVRPTKTKGAQAPPTLTSKLWLNPTALSPPKDSINSKSFPNLVGWANWPADKQELANLSQPSLGKTTLARWFTSRSILTLFLLKEWVMHVSAISEKPRVIYSRSSVTVELAPPSGFLDWRCVPGFSEMTQTFLLNLRGSLKLTRPVMSCSLALLRAEPMLINYYMRFIFSRTNGHQVAAVTDTLSRVAEWFSELKHAEKSLPSRFDVQYFTHALSLVLELDHHQLICRVLQLVYHGSDLFLGDVRKAIFSDFLLKKYFFCLFLHWDEVTRNFFHQLLLFKVLRFHYSQLERSSGLMQGNIPSRSGFLLHEYEIANDQSVFGKLLCYIKMIKDQFNHPQALPPFPKYLEIYSARALAEWKYFRRRSNTYSGTDWKLAPMILLEPGFKGTLAGQQRTLMHNYLPTN